MDGVTVDRLANLLAIVKNDGWDAAFSEDVHYGGRPSDVENITLRQYTEPLHSLRHSLEDAKLCMATLNNVKARLAKKIRNLQKRCTPLVLEDGIERIPDEILALVFEAGHKKLDNSGFALRVSHVSHRFRQVSLQTPSLWTRLSSDHPDDQIEAFISRSGRLDLQVTLSPYSVEKLRSSLRLLYPHSGRWSRLILTTHHSHLHIMDEFGLRSFPRLQYIFHEYYSLTNTSQWDMPLLSKFCAHSLQFSPGVSFPILLQLTCVELYFEDEDPIDMTSLAEVLSGMVNLHHLALEFGYNEDGNVDLGAGAQGPMFALRRTPEPHSFHVESLRITFRGYVRPGFIDAVYDTLNYLTASLVDISVLTYGEPDNSLTHVEFPYGSTIRLRTGLPCSLTFVLEALLRNCPIIRTVQFEMSSFNDFIYTPSWSKFSSFRHLRFRDCVMFEEERVEELVRALFGWEDFESFELISCHKITEEFLIGLQDEFGERLKWSL